MKISTLLSITALLCASCTRHGCVPHSEQSSKLTFVDQHLYLPAWQLDFESPLPPAALGLIEPIPATTDPDASPWSPQPSLHLIGLDGQTLATHRAVSPETSTDIKLGRSVDAQERANLYWKELHAAKVKDLFPGTSPMSIQNAEPPTLRDIKPRFGPETSLWTLAPRIPNREDTHQTLTELRTTLSQALSEQADLTTSPRLDILVWLQAEPTITLPEKRLANTEAPPSRARIDIQIDSKSTAPQDHSNRRALGEIWERFQIKAEPFQGAEFWFGFNRDTLDRENRAAVLHYAKRLHQEYPDHRVIVAGSSDEIGQAQVRQDIAKRRAEHVATLLRAQGLNPRLVLGLAVSHAGSASPTSPDPARRGKQRLVRLFLIPPADEAEALSKDSSLSKAEPLG